MQPQTKPCPSHTPILYTNIQYFTSNEILFILLTNLRATELWERNVPKTAIGSMIQKKCHTIHPYETEKVRNILRIPARDVWAREASVTRIAGSTTPVIPGRRTGWPARVRIYQLSVNFIAMFFNFFICTIGHCWSLILFYIDRSVFRSFRLYQHIRNAD